MIYPYNLENRISNCCIKSSVKHPETPTPSTESSLFKSRRTVESRGDLIPSSAAISQTLHGTAIYADQLGVVFLESM